GSLRAVRVSGRGWWACWGWTSPWRGGAARGAAEDTGRQERRSASYQAGKPAGVHARTPARSRRPQLPRGPRAYLGQQRRDAGARAAGRLDGRPDDEAGHAGAGGPAPLVEQPHVAVEGDGDQRDAGLDGQQEPPAQER